MSQTETYTKDKRAVINWAGGIAAVMITGALCFVASQINAHETAISVLRERDQAKEHRLEKMDEKLDKILDRLPALKGNP